MFAKSYRRRIGNNFIFIRAWFRKKMVPEYFLTGILIPPVGDGYGSRIPVWTMAEEIHDNFRICFGKFFIILLFGVSVSMTIYLARDFARMNKRLQLQLREIKQLFEKLCCRNQNAKNSGRPEYGTWKEKWKNEQLKYSLQKAELETKNRDILDNLNYARRIQSAICLKLNIYKNAIRWFIYPLYSERYCQRWFLYIFTERQTKWLFLPVHWTWVTGTFMSMIGSSFAQSDCQTNWHHQPAQIRINSTKRALRKRWNRRKRCERRNGYRFVQHWSE